MSKDQILKELRSLPTEDLLDVLQEVRQWDNAHPDVNTETSPEFRAELERRIADYEAHPEDGIPLDEALRMIDQTLNEK